VRYFGEFVGFILTIISLLAQKSDFMTKNLTVEERKNLNKLMTDVGAVELTPEEIELLKLFLKGSPEGFNKSELAMFINLILTVDIKALLKKLEGLK
jgi:hypothetical protein